MNHWLFIHDGVLWRESSRRFSGVVTVGQHCCPCCIIHLPVPVHIATQDTIGLSNNSSYVRRVIQAATVPTTNRPKQGQKRPFRKSAPVQGARCFASAQTWFSLGQVSQIRTG